MRNNRINTHTPILGLLFLILALPSISSAQEVYFSISGRNVTVTTGDRTGQYDYWFRPAAGVENPRSATVEIFDAGLGGFADVIVGQPNTITTYSLHNFDALYELGRRSIDPRAATAPVLESATASTENRFLNRWVPFFTLGEAEGENGFIMRVSTDEGNDVNDFRIRLTGDGASDWELITLNLSVGLYQSGPQNRFQFRPLWGDVAPPVFTLDGQEDSRVYLMDAFGSINEVDRAWTAYQATRYGKTNTWAVEMTGSDMRINNRVLKGAEKIVPFRFDPVILNEASAGAPDIIQTPGTECKVYGLEASYRGFSLDVANAQWNIDDTSFTGPSFRHTFTDFGTYSYRVLVPTRGRHVPQFVVVQGDLLVNTPPFAQVNNYRPIVSPGERITLDASMSFDPEGRPLQYQWFVNGDFRGSNPTFTFSNSVSGRYDIRLVLNDNEPNSSCTETVEFLPIVVNTQPYAEIQYNRVIASGVENTISVINDLDADGDALTFSWEGAGVQGAGRGRDVVVSHAEPGTYTILLRVNDQTGTANAEYRTEVSYKVNAAPIPSFTLPQFLAPGQPLALDARGSRDPDGDPLEFAWQLSDGRQLSGAEREVNFTEPGRYEITLTVNDGENVENSVQSLTQSVHVNAAPVPRIVATELTNNPIVSFDASSSTDSDQQIVSYEWSFGDGATATGVNPVHTFRNHGTYTVSLTVDDGTGVPNSRQSVTHQVRVNKNPVAAATAPSVVAPGETFRLDASASTDPDGGPLTFRWTRSGKLIGESAGLDYAISQPGIYNLDVTVRDDTPFEDASDNATVSVRVNHAPVIVYATSPSVTAPGRSTTFDASRTFDPDNENLSIRWEFSDDISLDGASVQRSFSEPGEYYYTIIADDGEGLRNSVTRKTGSIRVNTSPIIVTEPRIRSNDMTVLLDASESYDPDGERLRFTWTLPDGTTRNEARFRWTAPEPGVHAISLLLDDGEGLSNSTVTQRIEVLINQPPVAVVEGPIQSCTDQVIIFSSARSFDPDGDSFRTMWDFGDGTTSLEANPVHSYSRPGRYTARITLDDGFNAAPTVQEIPVIIEGSPQARIQATEFTVCANSPITFDGSGSTDPNGMVGSYSWDFGDMNSAVGEKTTHLFTRPGTYRVTLTISGSGTGTCPNISQATAIVTVVAAPMARFEVPSDVAPGDAIMMNGTESETTDNITSVNWTVRKNGEEVTTFTGMRNTFTPQEPGRYEIELVINTDNQAGCSLNSLTRVVQVNAAPEIVWNLPEKWAQYEPFRLSALGSADTDGFIGSYTWYFNGEEIGNGLTTPMPVTEFGTHTVELVVRDNAAVGNSEVRKSGEVVISPSPVPGFELPANVFAGEVVNLRAIATADAAGNAVTSRWVVNGDELTSDDARLSAGGSVLRFVADRERYDIELIQDDGLELSNSVRTVRKVMPVSQFEVPRVALPAVVVSGTSISAGDFGLPSGYVVLDSREWGAAQVFTPGVALVGDARPAGLEVASEWVARLDGDAGSDRLFVGWQPRGEGTPVLAVFGFEVAVVAPLRADAQRVELRAGYNPVNSSVLVEAPGLNRDSEASVSYGWRRAGSGDFVARGGVARLGVERGANAFELVITDDVTVLGRRELVIPVTITVE